MVCRALGLRAPPRRSRRERARPCPGDCRKPSRIDPHPGRATEGLLGQRGSAPDRPLAGTRHHPPLGRFRLRRRRPAGDRGVGLRGRCRRQPAGFRSPTGADAAAAGGDVGKRAHPPARAPRLGALAQRLAVRAPASSSAADDVVAVARLRAGRSDPEPRDDGNAGAARARTANRSDAGPESLARRCAGRREQAQSRARRSRGQPQGQSRAMQADRAAQAATASAAGTGGQASAAATGSSAPAAGRRASGAADQPAAARPIALQLVGRFRRRRRHPQQTLSGG